MFLVPVLIYLLFNSAIVVMTKRSFGKCMPLSIMIIPFLLFFSQYFLGTYKVGILISMSVALLAIPLCIIKRKQIERKNMFSTGSFIFLAIVIFVLIWDYHRHFAIFDEFYHWGLMVKESLKLDKFYCIDESRLYIHKDYPPFLTLIEVFFCKFAGYSEGKVSAALHIFVLSMGVLPVAEDIVVIEREKRKPAPVKAFIIGILLIFIFLTVAFSMDGWTPRGITSILADVPPAIVFAYAIYLIYSDETKTVFGMVSLMLANAAIIMMK